MVFALRSLLENQEIVRKVLPAETKKEIKKEDVVWSFNVDMLARAGSISFFFSNYTESSTIAFQVRKELRIFPLLS